LNPLSVVGSRFACATLPGGKVLGQTCAEFLGVRGVAVDLDEARFARESSQETHAAPLGLTCWIRVVTEVGVLSLRVDLVMCDGGARRAQSLLPELLGEVIEAIAHGRPEPPG